MTKDLFIHEMNQQLKLVRTEYNLTQDAMAKALGLSKKTLVEIEKGRSSLGWMGAVALCTIFSESQVLSGHLGGKAEDMIRLGHQMGFTTHVVPEVQMDGAPISSTRIRAAIAEGDMEEATRLLGRPYMLCGVVQHGKKLGRKHDFPTANMPWPAHKAMPPKGVYAALCDVNGEQYMAAVNIGSHPTAPGGERTIEANLLDYEGGDLYGKHMRLSLCSFIRPERKFDSMEALREEVMRNREQVYAYFGILKF